MELRRGGTTRVKTHWEDQEARTTHMWDAPMVMVGEISSSRGGMITVVASRSVGDRQGVINNRKTPTSDGRQSSRVHSERKDKTLILALLLELVDSSEV
jgi:hypothetical protein